VYRKRRKSCSHFPRITYAEKCGLIQCEIALQEKEKTTNFVAFYKMQIVLRQKQGEFFVAVIGCSSL
jgi:hypothetical protein